MVAKDTDALRALARRLKEDRQLQRRDAVRGPQGAASGQGRHAAAASDEPTVRRRSTPPPTRQAHVDAAALRPSPRRPLDRPPTSARVFDPKRIVVAQRLPGLLNTRWGRSLTNGAAVLEEGGPGLSLPFVLQTDAARINDNDLPFAARRAAAADPRPGAPLSRQRLRPAHRVPAQGRPDRFGGLDSFQSGLPSFLRVDVNGLLNGLTNDGTISSDDGLAHFAARTDPPDPSDGAPHSNA